MTAGQLLQSNWRFSSFICSLSEEEEQIQALYKRALELEKEIEELLAQKQKIHGLPQLLRQLRSDIKFLHRVASGKELVTPVHVRTSNIPFFVALLSVVKQEQQVVSVLKCVSSRSLR